MLLILFQYKKVMKNIKFSKAENSRSRADIHIHSKYSDHPSEWLLRRIGAHESYVEPEQIYRSCKEKGMDFVTVSDHNSIDGALEIAHLPDTFISSELTAYFPENRTKIHCLVFDINERQFSELNVIRNNIYDLREYLHKNDILYSIAHPLFRVDGKLTEEQFEKLILMFNRFEGINGSRKPCACEIAAGIMNNLSEKDFYRLADKYNIEPFGERPWIKAFTGGSDDHSGLFQAGAYTETPYSADVKSFIANIRNKNHCPGGEHGSSMLLAGSLIQIAYSYYKDKFADKKQGINIIGSMFSGMLKSDNYGNKDRKYFSSPVKRIIEPIIKHKKESKLSETEKFIISEFKKVISEEKKLKNSGFTESLSVSERRFKFAARAGHQLSYVFLGKFFNKIKKGHLIGAVESIASLSPVAVGFAPYLASFSTQHKDRNFLRSIAEKYSVSEYCRGKNKKAWFTDTINDLNGVSKTIRMVSETAKEKNYPLTVFTSTENEPEYKYDVRNFKPVGTFSLDDYPDQGIVFPPYLEVLRELEEGEYDEIIVSTPGPMGLIAVAASALFNIPLSGIYHTDFPRYIANWTDDPGMGEAALKYMQWFYSRMKKVYVPSRTYLKQLEDMGFKSNSLKLMKRGVDMKKFSPLYRESDFWEKYGLEDKLTYLYVGRISKEKDLDVLFRAAEILEKEKYEFQIAVVGSGPDEDMFKKMTKNADNIVFTGRLDGIELSKAYASSDVFVFPSTTDTYGNVVLEANASGLPAVVSDRGGPCEIISLYGSGIIAEAYSAESFAEAMLKLAVDEQDYCKLKKQSIINACENSWDSVAEVLFA